MRASIVALLLLCASTARADEPPRWLVSLPLLGVDRAAVVVQGEHYLNPRLTVLAAVGGRWPDAGDYEARALVAGSGVRWFFYPAHRGGGAFFSTRLDATRRWLVDDVDGRNLGTVHALSWSTFMGWRLVAWRHLELTPEFGVVTAREWSDTMLPARSQVGVGVGITLGYLF